MNAAIVESFAAIAREKGVDKDYLQNVIKEVFLSALKKTFGKDATYEIVVNMDKGDIEIYWVREIVEKVEDPQKQISIEEVEKLGNPDELEVGEEYAQKISLDSFGRRVISNVKQSLSQKIMEIEKDLVYNEYKQMLNEIIVGEIYQIRKNDILVIHNKKELILPREEQIPKEKYKKGQTIRAVVKRVEKTNKGPRIIISRTDNEFLRRLFEIEVPEIYDGIIAIKKIAREPGERAKVAVEAKDKRIDAVGACVGMKGVRIHAIVRELNNENIDVINYSEDVAVLIQRSFSPAKLKKIEILEDERKAIVYAEPDQVPIIVGKDGVNIRLTMKLTGYYIELIRETKDYSQSDDDIELIDLRNELGREIVDILINNRYDTALEVLNAGEEEISKIKELDDDKVQLIFDVIKRKLS